MNPRFHIPTIGISALIGALLCGGGFVVGRYMTPASVEKTDRHTVTEMQKVENTYVQKVDTEELRRVFSEVVQKMVLEMAQKNNVVTKKKKTTKPNGEIEEEEETKDLSETNTKSQTDTSTKTQSEVLTRETLSLELKLLAEKLKVDEQVHSVKTTNDKLPNYSIGVNVGYDFASMFGRGAGFNITPVRNVVLQLQFEKRLIGPLYGVGWIQSTGVGGLGLKANFL